VETKAQSGHQEPLAYQDFWAPLVDQETEVSPDILESRDIQDQLDSKEHEERKEQLELQECKDSEVPQEPVELKGHVESLALTVEQEILEHLVRTVFPDPQDLRVNEESQVPKGQKELKEPKELWEEQVTLDMMAQQDVKEKLEILEIKDHLDHEDEQERLETQESKDHEVHLD